jgi:Arc/MetJ family transcription regulator
MRTNIVIDDKLMADVMALGGFKTKREAVEEGLRMLKRRKAYDGLLALRGKLQWIGDDEAAWAKYREEQMAKVQAKAAGLPFEGEIDPVFLQAGFEPQVQPAATVQEAAASYSTVKAKVNAP